MFGQGMEYGNLVDLSPGDPITKFATGRKRNLKHPSPRLGNLASYNPVGKHPQNAKNGRSLLLYTFSLGHPNPLK